MPGLSGPGGLERSAASLDVPDLPPAVHCDGRHDLCGHTLAAAGLVSRRLVGDQPEVRASALGLQRVLGLGSYETAWSWLHKLRRAMVRPGRERLSGVVEVDEAFIGGVTPGADGRDGEGKALVVIAAEADGPGIGRIRLGRVPDASAASLHGFIQQAVTPGSTVHTDGWAPYQGLTKLGYPHHCTPLKGRGKEAAVKLLPRVHRVAALLKRWLLGTHQGAVAPEHLDYYLDEFTFRFNRRRSASRGKLFFRLLEQAVQIGPVPYKVIIHPTRHQP